MSNDKIKDTVKYLILSYNSCTLISAGATPNTSTFNVFDLSGKDSLQQKLTKWYENNNN